MNKLVRRASKQNSIEAYTCSLICNGPYNCGCSAVPNDRETRTATIWNANHILSPVDVQYHK